MKLALAFTETSFSAAVAEEIRFTRIDTGQAVDVAARLQSVPFAPQTFALMQKCLDGSATAAGNSGVPRMLAGASTHLAT